MNIKSNIRKTRSLVLCLSLSLLLSGCTSRPDQALDGQAWDEDWIQIGTILGIEAPKQFTLLDNMDILAAEGLYYATWVTGASVPYENSEGNTIDLYDAQLYLISSENTDEKAAEKNRLLWLASAKENYQIHEENTIECNGQFYTLITYDCVSEDTPYDHGVSALGVCGANAICAELTCVEDYDGDLTSLLTDFLEGCHYSASIQAES